MFKESFHLFTQSFIQSKIMLRVRSRRRVKTKGKKKMINHVFQRILWFEVGFYVHHFLLCSMYTIMVQGTCRLTINISEDLRATKLLFLQHVTGLPGAGRAVYLVCKHVFFPFMFLYFRKIQHLHLIPSVPLFLLS